MIAMIALATVSCLALSVQGQAPTLTNEDIQAASWEFQNYLDPELTMRKISIRDVSVNLPDGNRGYIYTPDYEVGTTPYKGDPSTDSALRFRQDVCSSVGIVIAQAGSASTYLVHENQGIITARRFLVSEIFRGDLSQGASITVVEFGGVIRDGTETLEVGIRGMKPLKRGNSYLVFLEKAPNHPSSVYFNFNFAHPQLIHGRIYAEKRAGDDIIDPPYGIGETVEKFQANLKKVESLGKCQQPSSVQ